MNWLWLALILVGGYVAWLAFWELYVTIRVSRETPSEDRYKL